MKTEPFLIASTINLIFAQRLVRKIYPDVKQKYKLTAAEIKRLGTGINLDKILKILRQEKIVGVKDDWPDIEFYRPGKSEECPDGYKGRIGIYEVLKISESIKELIVKEATADQIQELAISEGMMTMLEDGFIKAAQGITSIEEILRVTDE